MNDSDVEALIARYRAAWERADADAAAAVFSDSAVFTSPDYRRFAGRDAIARGQRQAFDGPMRGTRIGVAVQSMRWLRSDLAIALTSNRITNADGTLAFPESYGMLVADGMSGCVEIAAYHNMVPLMLRVAGSRAGSARSATRSTARFQSHALTVDEIDNVGEDDGFGIDSCRGGSAT